MNANTKKMNRLTLAAAALLLTAVPLAAPAAQATVAGKTVSVAFTYDRDSAPERIYASLRRQARDFCAPGALSRQHLSWSQRRCVTQLVGKAVNKIGRPALADMHTQKRYAG